MAEHDDTTALKEKNTQLLEEKRKIRALPKAAPQGL